VEAETLACGSGSVASAILLSAWGEAEPAELEGKTQAQRQIELETSSGRILKVRLSRRGEAWFPALSGEGRVVFQGTLAEL
jgi:diaminopimelate epimerase